MDKNNTLQLKKEDFEISTKTDRETVLFAEYNKDAIKVCIVRGLLYGGYSAEVLIRDSTTIGVFDASINFHIDRLDTFEQALQYVNEAFAKLNEITRG